jgi:hypothetical protein
MKKAQVVGFCIAIMAVCYYLSFADSYAANESSSPSSGFGVMLVLLMLLVSAFLLIPSSVQLWRKKTRDENQFRGPVWLSLVALNSILSLLYSAALLWLIFMTIKLSF